MSVEKFIEGLQQRGLLSDRLMDKLRDKLAQSDRPLSAKAIAKFLVEKNHLTQREATEVLGSLVRSGVDVDSAAAEETAEDEAADEITPIISPASVLDIANSPTPQLSADEVPTQLRGMLRGTDQNGNGTLDAQELQAIQQRMNERIRGQRSLPPGISVGPQGVTGTPQQK